jgi:hypothetical protein
MTWFAAHVIMYVKLKAGPQRRYPVWENVVLIEAKSADAALKKAEQHGRVHEGDADGTFTWGGKPATWIFAGVRKLVMCQDEQVRPTDGTEVTYSELEVKSEADALALGAGQAVMMRYSDDDGEPPADEVSDPPAIRPRKPESKKRTG